MREHTEAGAFFTDSRTSVLMVKQTWDGPCHDGASTVATGAVLRTGVLSISPLLTHGHCCTVDRGHIGDVGWYLAT